VQTPVPQGKPEGPVSAAILGAGIGALALGFFTTLAEVSAGVKTWLQWNDVVGPLSGKTSMAVAVWLIAWAILHVALRVKAYETRRAMVISAVLIALGVLGTFPTFFQAFAP
jgi:DMSO reductase anchor subunit